MYSDKQRLEAWDAISKAAYDAGWVDDWFTDTNAIEMVWYEYVAYRIRTSNLPRDTKDSTESR